jgi:hypothetical protein
MYLDVSYKKKQIEKWFAKWLPGNEYTIDKDLNVKTGNINLNSALVTELPANITIDGWLDLHDSRITKLPVNLKIDGWIDLSYCKDITKLPFIKIYKPSITTEPWIDITKSSITIESIPRSVTSSFAILGGKHERLIL